MSDQTAADDSAKRSATVEELLERQRREHPEQFRHRERPARPADAPVDGDNGGA